MKKIIISIFMMGFTIIFLCGFIVKEDKKEVTDNDRIIYSINNITNNLINISNLNKREQDLICATSKGLFYKNIDGEIIPEIAESYEINDSGIEYVFKIKEDIFWSDGSKITVNDIYNFLKELIFLQDKNDVVVLYDIYGVNDYKNKKVSFENGVAITCRDNEIKIRLNNKNDKFIDELTKPQYRLRKRIQLWSQMDTFYSNIIYSGDYKIITMNSEEIELENVTGNGNEIVMKKDNNTEEAMAAFKVGNRDIIINPPENELNDLNQKGNLLTYPSNKGEYLYIDEKSTNMIASVRGAIYKNICEAIDEYESTNSMKVEWAEGSFIRADKENVNLIQSRKVSINTISDLNDINNLSICAISNIENKKICEYLSNWFKENKSIKLKYYLLDKDDYKEAQINNKYSMYLLSNEETFSRKTLFYESIKDLFSTTEKDIYEKYKNTDENYYLLEEDLLNSYRILPLFYYNDNIAISNKVSGVKMDYYGNLIF